MTDLPQRVNPYPLPASLSRRNRPRRPAPEAAAHRPPEPVRLQVALPMKPRIISTAHGTIEHLLLAYPAYAAGEYSYRAIYADLIRQLPGTTRYTVVVHPSVSNDLKALLDETDATLRTTVILAPDYLDFTVWTEDPFVAVQNLSMTPPGTILLEPYLFTRGADAVLAGLVAAETDIAVQRSPLYYQGGNVLIGDEFVLLGADYPAETLKMLAEYEAIQIPAGAEPAAFLHDLYQQSFDPQRRLLYVGTKERLPQEETRAIKVGQETWQETIYAWTGDNQPIFHLDMFIALAGRSAAGKYRLVVGSPAEAARLLGQPLAPYALQDAFDEIAAQLAALGFEVIRNPLPLTYVDDPQAKSRFWYCATANNCLVQIVGDKPTVWLPTYGHGAWADLAKVDAENRRIWESLGFTVHALGDYHPFAQNLGAVHCIKKFLARGEG